MRMLRMTVLLLLLLPALAGPSIAQWLAVTKPEELFKAARFAELDRDYARVLAARARNHWGEYFSEEFFRRLQLTPMWDSPQGFARPPEAELDALTQAWLRHSPRSAAAAIARANWLLQQARTAYNTRDWDAGDAFTQSARSLLLQVRAAARPDPNWHFAWLYIGKLEGWSVGEVMAAIEDAAQREPAAVGPWMAAVAALSPDGRAPVLLGPLAQLAVRKTKATEGRAMHARIYLMGARLYASLRSAPFTRGGMDWPAMNVALGDLQARYPDPGTLNQHAALACLAGDRPATAALVGKIGPRPQRQHWEFWGGSPLYERCKAWASQGNI
jgi:hypothetical protein